MTLRLRLASWLLALAALIPQSASARRPDPAAAALADPAATRAVDWRPVELTPVPLAPGVPAWAAEPVPEARTERTLEVGPDRAALVRVGPLAALLVRAEPGSRGALTFWRRTGPPGPGRAAVAEPGVLVSPGTWRIEQPPGSGGEWLIGAD
ncbi:MAG TPA: hypothetical protein VIK91_26370, partial [Nannocystis sp.]